MKINLLKKVFSNDELRNPNPKDWVSFKTDFQNKLNEIILDDDGFPNGTITISIDFNGRKTKSKINTVKTE